MQMDFEIALASGKTRARLYQANNGAVGLTLIGDNGRPVGHGRTMTPKEAEAFATALKGAKSPAMIKSLVWSKLGYGLKTHKPVASGMCHPGRIRLHGRL